MFRQLENYLNFYPGEIRDRMICYEDGTIVLDCYFMGEEFDVDAWENQKVFIKPQTISARSFRAAYRVARVLKRALDTSAAKIEIPRIPADIIINIDIMPDAPFCTV